MTDLWSRWVDWGAASSNAKYLPMFNLVGGDAIDAGAGTAIPFYAFLINGWRVKPQEASHTLNVSNGVLLVDGGGDPFVNTTGSFIVRINYSQPVQAITVSTSGGGGGASAADIWAYGTRALTTADPTIPTASDNARAVWNSIVEAGLTAEELLRVMASVLAGKVSGAGSGTEVFRDLADTKNRVTVTTDPAGNRTAVARNAT